MKKFLNFVRDYRRYIITLMLGIGLVIAVILEKNLESKHYATLSFALLISVYWVVETIIMYVEFRKTYPENYKLYIAQIVNQKDISAEQVKLENKKYYKQFKRTMIKDSWIGISYICVAIGLTIAFIVSLAI